MRIAWFSNPPWVPSGYGSQSALLLPRLRALGHEICIIPTRGGHHGMQEWNGFHVFPSGKVAWSDDVLPAFAARFGADITLGFIDAWVLQPQTIKACPRFVSLYPVDHEPLSKLNRQNLAECWDRIAYSKFGVAKTIEAGLTCHYAPHGYDGSVLYPDNKSAARNLMNLPDDGRFIVGTVSANNDRLPSRKAWAEMAEGFKRFYDRCGGRAIWYLHTWIYGDCNLAEILEFFELPKDVIHCCNQELQRIGFNADWMRATYNAMDVLLMPSMGEGFGLSCIEAQACGTPVITGDWTATGELCFHGQKIHKRDATRYLTQQIAYQYIPHVDAIADALTVAEARKGACYEPWRIDIESYEIDAVVNKYWKPLLERLERRIQDERAIELLASQKEAVRSLKISMVVPTYNGAKNGNLGECVASAFASLAGSPHTLNVLIFDHGDQSILFNSDAIVVHKSPHGNCSSISSSWNRGISAAFAFGMDAVLIVNDDIVFGPGDVAQLAEETAKHVDDDVATVCCVGTQNRPTPHRDSIGHSCFGLTRAGWERIGAFDESFVPAYFEDNDYSYRMKMARMSEAGAGETTIVHKGSDTTYSDPSLRQTFVSAFEANRDYYIRKWGGKPDEEQFSRPFNSGKE